MLSNRYFLGLIFAFLTLSGCSVFSALAQQKSIVIEQYEQHELDQRIVFSLQAVDAIRLLIPVSVKNQLSREGIAIDSIVELARKQPKGSTLIEVDSVRTGERTVIKVE